MPVDPDTFDLTELSAAAGVTPRTIRYYVQQGLLPSPGTRGPGTRYESAYLDRLQLIRRLQRQHLPLAEIRRRLEALGDGDVRDALSTSPEPPTASSALEYVRGLLSRQATRTGMAEGPPATGTFVMAAVPPPASPSTASKRSTSTLGAIFGRAQSLHRVRPPEPPPAAPSAPQPHRSTRSTWERIPLASDVELHVRRPLSREQNRQVERLIEAARDLFAEES